MNCMKSGNWIRHLTTSLVIFLAAPLLGCATKIEIVDEADIKTATTKEDAILFGQQFIAKGTKLRVRNFKNGIRAVSFGVSNLTNGGVLVVGGMPAFVPMTFSSEHLFEVNHKGCLTGKRISFDSFLRNWMISDDPSITPEVLKPPRLCFDEIN